MYKSDKQRKAYYYPHNNFIEKIWTIVPAIVLTVLVLMGFLTWRSIFYKESKTLTINQLALKLPHLSFSGIFVIQELMA
jgi:heme/copper-type cytochrome/quinol oxidase subunit 2